MDFFALMLAEVGHGLDFEFVVQVFDLVAWRITTPSESDLGVSSR